MIVPRANPGATGRETVISLNAVAAADDDSYVLNFVIVGSGAFGDTASPDQLAQRVDVNIATRLRKTFLLHVGQKGEPVRIGPVSMCGAAHRQKDDVETFCRDALEWAGAFGSWWSVTEAYLRRFADRFGAHTLVVNYLTDDAARLPLEWSEAAFSSWMAERRRMWGPRISDVLRIISRRPAAECFAHGDFVERLSLDEWLSQGSWEAAGGAELRLSISVPGWPEEIRPQLLLEGAQLEVDFPGGCLISFPASAVSSTCDLALLKGIEASQVRLRLV